MKCQKTRSFKGKDAVVGKGQEKAFGKVLKEGTAAANISSIGFCLGWWWPGVCVSQYSRLICFDTQRLMESTG